LQLRFAGCSRKAGASQNSKAMICQENQGSRDIMRYSKRLFFGIFRRILGITLPFKQNLPRARGEQRWLLTQDVAS
jgi:hypothetical protein